MRPGLTFPTLLSFLALLSLTACASSGTETGQVSSATPLTTASTSQLATVSPSASPSPSSPAPTQATEAPAVTEPAQAPSPEAPASAPAASPAPTQQAQPVTSPSLHASPSMAAGSPVCDYSQLHIAAAADTGAAGSRYITLTFTNTSASPCLLSGYPTVTYVDAAGNQVGGAASQASEWSASGGVLQPSQALTATLRETRAQLYGANCQAAQATGFSIQAPGASQALTLAFPAEACANASLGQLTVGAVGAQP